MNTTTAPAGDAELRQEIIRREVKLLKVARDASIGKVSRFRWSLDRWATNGVYAESSQRGIALLTGETLFADRNLSLQSDFIGNAEYLIDPVAKATQLLHRFACDCDPRFGECLYVYSSAHEAADSIHDEFHQLLNRYDPYTERIHHFFDIKEEIAQTIGKVPSIGDWPMWGKDRKDNWQVCTDWIDLDRACAAVQEFLELLPNGDGTFFRTLEDIIIEESRSALAYARGLPVGPPQSLPAATVPEDERTTTDTPEKPAADNAPVNRLPNLDADDWKLLEAAFALGATSMESKTKHIEIAKHLDPHVINADHLKRPMGALVKSGFFNSKGGRGGGVWLTTQGLETVRKR